MIQEFIKNRYSPYAFSDVPVSSEQLKTLFEAARWAPSSFNEQPWRFVYTTKDREEDFNRFVSVLMDINQVWAMHAPVIGLSLAKITFSYNGKPNRFAEHDTGLAMGGLLAQATHLGLKVHQMGGYDVEQARQKFGITKDFMPMAMFVIGHPGDGKGLPEIIRKKESTVRIRNAPETFVFLNSFSPEAAGH